MSDYTPAFLIQTKLDAESLNAAEILGMKPEDFCREAIKFFAANCVHTQMKKRMSRKRKASRETR